MLTERDRTQLVREIEGQALAAQQQIGQARAQTAAKQREMRMVRLTLDEISKLPAESNVFEGVGKMYAVSFSSTITWAFVFLLPHGRGVLRLTKLQVCISHHPQIVRETGNADEGKGNRGGKARTAASLLGNHFQEQSSTYRANVENTSRLIFHAEGAWWGKNGAVYEPTLLYSNTARWHDKLGDYLGLVRACYGVLSVDQVLSIGSMPCTHSRPVSSLSRVAEF